jgi:NAD(P)H dehydrogenase (quinone)
MRDTGSTTGSSENTSASASNARRTVLVAAAGGHQGRLLVPKLAAEGFLVRAVRATPGRERELLDLGASEVFAADLSDLDTYTHLLEGVDTVYHIGPGASQVEKLMGETLIEAATRAGVDHVVFSSVLHPIIPIVQHHIKRDLEVRLIESSLNYTVLKPVDYMMPEQYSLPAFEAGVFPTFWRLDEPRRGSLIALDDLTDVAVKVIKEGPPHYFASYELVGPDKLTAFEVAEILSKVTGKEVQAVEWKPDEMLQRMFGDDRSSPEAQHRLAVISSVSQWYGRHSFIGNPRILTWLLGRKPTTYEEFVTKAFAEYSQRSA